MPTITCPNRFRAEELIARLKALLRRSRSTVAQPANQGLHVDEDRMTIFLDGEPAHPDAERVSCTQPFGAQRRQGGFGL